MFLSGIDIVIMGGICLFIFLSLVASTFAYIKRKSYAVSYTSLLFAGLFTVLLAVKLYAFPTPQTYQEIKEHMKLGIEQVNV
ncbi:hypothetical protein [Paenibacillus sp. 481]|uniref:hypothetical protein n=1 Tax=Paenibacillus sp. 481 TaxID=2835869 RepID=UPI001E323412|nr:hypothetical protein [Paenibacillus sp. 481]UHA72435.1 hypothetical protein KIK04_17400 [Paenibacillus sp. 481]